MAFLITNNDITDRKRAEEALRQSEERFRALVQFSFDVYWETDAQHRFVRQEFSERLTDAPPPGSELGKTRWEVPYVEPDEEAWRKHRETLDAHLPFRDFVLSRPTPDGGKRYVSVSGMPVFDATGRFVGYRGVGRHVTDQKSAEQALRDSEEQWRAVFENNPTMYFMVDAAGTIVSVNPFGAEQLGYQVGQLVGQPVLNVFCEPDREPVRSRAEACFEQPGRTMRWEARKVRKNGTILWVRETAKAVVLKNRPVLLVVCEDITEQRHAEEAARRSDKELRDVVETIPAMVWSALPDGSNAFVNGRWAEYTGLSAPDSTGAGWQAAVHPEDVDRHVRNWRASVATGKLYEDEVRFRRADGEYRWFLVRGVPLRDEQGRILKWYGILTDIEDRKRVEALLAGEKRILEMVAKGDSLRRILDSLCRLVEEQASGVLASILLVDGNRLRHGGAPTLPKAYIDAIDGVLIGPSVASCGTAAYRGEQVMVADIATDPLWTEYRDAALPHSLRACWSTPIFSPDRNVIATFAMYYREPRTPSLRDQEIIEQITHLAGVAIQRKLTEEKLQRNEAYLAEAQRLTQTGSWAWDPHTDKVLFWSAEMFRIFGIDPVRGAPARETFWRRVHREDRDRAYETIRRSVRQKTDYVVDHRIVLPDGTVKHIQTIGHPVVDAAGNIVEYVGTAVDVTERKRAEQERERRRQLEAELAHTNRLTTMGELTASLAHEVNQPISAAITNANACLRWLTRNRPNLEQAREAATAMIADAGRAAAIIDRLRSFYRKGASQPREPVDVNELAREMLMLLYAEASRYSITVRTDFAPDLPKVMADRVQLQQVLMNLMLNGIEAMKEGGGELTITSQPANDGHLQVSVADTGVGLPPGKMDQIFNAFFTTKPQGTGMGLAISRSIVESHGGRLWAAANSGRGAIFSFTVPRQHSA